MQFIVIARDNENSLEKRMKVRDAHITLWDTMVKNKTALFGLGLLDENQKMNGSVYIVDFDTRDELDKWLEIEPYMQWNVWGDIEIIECKIWPSFCK